MCEAYNMTQRNRKCSKDRRVASASVQMFPFLEEEGVHCYKSLHFLDSTVLDSNYWCMLRSLEKT